MVRKKKRKKKNKRFDLNVCNLDYRRLSESIAKADKIVQESNKKADDSIISFEMKENSNNRLQNMFKMLWFFGIIFLLGVSITLENLDIGFIMQLFSVYFIASGLFLIVSIGFYILAELSMFLNKSNKYDKVIFEMAESGYSTAIIKMLLVFIVFTLLLLLTGVFYSEWMSLNFSQLISPETVLWYIKISCIVTGIVSIILMVHVLYRLIKVKNLSELEKNLINKILNILTFMESYILPYLTFIFIAIYMVENIIKL